jgi:hypothetical protein
MSSVEADYLENGFKADNQQQELYADGLTVSFLRSMEEVTDQICEGPDGAERGATEQAIDSISDELLRQYDNDPFTSARIIPFIREKIITRWSTMSSAISGWWLPRHRRWESMAAIRQWMWPRHTGDFSVFRVYADRNNKPAKYSVDNVPYRPNMWCRSPWEA